MLGILINEMSLCAEKPEDVQVIQSILLISYATPQKVFHIANMQICVPSCHIANVNHTRHIELYVEKIL